MNQENNDRRRDNGIERWETLKIMTADTRTTNEGTEVRVSLVVSRPIFKDGNVGYPKASLVIMRDRAVFRIPFFKGSADEADFINDMMGDALDKWDESGRDEFDQMIRDHRDTLNAIRQKDIDEHNKMLDNLAATSGKDHSNKRRRRKNADIQEDA